MTSNRETNKIFHNFFVCEDRVFDQRGNAICVANLEAPTFCKPESCKRIHKLRTTTSAYEGEEILVCPVCGFEYVHPLKVKVAIGNCVTVVDSNGTRMVEGETAESIKAVKRRGVRIILEYRCENGHHGNLILQFSKGVTFVEHETLDSERGGQTLWRT